MTLDQTSQQIRKNRLVHFLRKISCSKRRNILMTYLRYRLFMRRYINTKKRKIMMMIIFWRCQIKNRLNLRISLNFLTVNFNFCFNYSLSFRFIINFCNRFTFHLYLFFLISLYLSCCFSRRMILFRITPNKIISNSFR